MVADEERRMISARTKAALAAPKRRGKKLGGYRGAKITPSIRRATKAAVKARTGARAQVIWRCHQRTEIGRHYQLERTRERSLKALVPISNSSHP
jgi:DNA invertase Pin-like site-specific DNA recombinase